MPFRVHVFLLGLITWHNVVLLCFVEVVIQLPNPYLSNLVDNWSVHPALMCLYLLVFHQVFTARGQTVIPLITLALADMSWWRLVNIDCVLYFTLSNAPTSFRRVEPDGEPFLLWFLWQLLIMFAFTFEFLILLISPLMPHCTRRWLDMCCMKAIVSKEVLQIDVTKSDCKQLLFTIYI